MCEVETLGYSVAHLRTVVRGFILTGVCIWADPMGEMRRERSGRRCPLY